MDVWWFDPFDKLRALSESKGKLATLGLQKGRVGRRRI